MLQCMFKKVGILKNYPKIRLIQKKETCFSVYPCLSRRYEQFLQLSLN